MLPEKNPLQNKWCLWYFKNDKSIDWKDNLTLVASFDTVSGLTVVAISYGNVVLLVCAGRRFLGVSVFGVVICLQVQILWCSSMAPDFL